LVLLARQKNTPGRAWQRVLFHCPYGHRTNQTYIAAKHPKHFYVKDNLGSTRAVVDVAGDVVEAYDYYPFGLQSHSYKEKGDPLTKETFTGKEQDIESNLHYFGARYYDAGAGRFLSTDAFSERYFNLSPCAYVGNSPSIFVDVNGDSIDVSAMSRYDITNETNYVQILVNDLKAKTGLTITVDGNGKLHYEKDKDGNAIVKKGKDGKEIGSATARMMLVDMIDNTNAELSAYTTPGKGSRAYEGANQIGLDPLQIIAFIDGAEGGLDNTTLGWGLMFLHESLHTPMGGSLKDDLSSFGATGSVVDRINTIRSELGSEYGQRKSYKAVEINGKKYLPFSLSSLHSLKENIVPTGMRIEY
jgi:RHS repeat-associated protein